MRCVDCEYHRYFVGTHWCEATKKHKRITEANAHKDAPCKRGKPKGAN